MLSPTLPDRCARTPTARRGGWSVASLHPDLLRRVIDHCICAEFFRLRQFGIGTSRRNHLRAGGLAI